MSVVNAAPEGKTKTTEQNVEETNKSSSSEEDVGPIELPVGDEVQNDSSMLVDEQSTCSTSIDLPSIGIMVEDQMSTPNESSSSDATMRTKCNNSSIRKVSARLSLEPCDNVDIKTFCANDGVLAEKEEFNSSLDTPEQLPTDDSTSTPFVTIDRLHDVLTVALPPENDQTPGIHSNEICSRSDLVDSASKLEENISNVCSSSALAANSASFAGFSDVDTKKKMDVISPSEVMHKVKRIRWRGKEVPIITQNNNGPCPLLAILNALLLKGQVDLGVTANEVRGGNLVSVVANALIDMPPPSSNPQMLCHVHRNTDDSVNILHKLLTGLDVNVKFSGVQDFEYTRELCVFDGVQLNLYHGWVVDPECSAAEVVQGLSYNQLTNNIFTWRHQASATQDDHLMMKAVLCEEFLASTGSQLTVHGLFTLAATLAEDEVAVLFRNNHFATIYKHQEQLYQLLTDQGFLNEAAVWETLSDVDAAFSEFVTAGLLPIQHGDPTGGIPGGHGQGRGGTTPTMTTQQQITTDKELAVMLQKEIDQRCRDEASFTQTLQALGCQQDTTDEEIARRLQEEEDRLAAEAAAAAAPPDQSGPSERGGAAGHTDEDVGAAGGGGAAYYRRSSSSNDAPVSPSRQNKKKKKDQCCIL